PTTPRARTSPTCPSRARGDAMYAHAAAAAYRRVYVDSAGPGQVLDQLLSGLIADIRRAEECIRGGDPPGKGTAISRGLRIVAQLSAALDHRRAPELCKNLESLYGFVASRLTQASVALDAELLPPVAQIVTTVRDAFRSV